MIFSSKKNLEEHIKPRVKKSVYEAFKKVDRKWFVPDRFSEYAYFDTPIPLSKYSTVSQPSLVAKMIDLLDLTGKEKVLEVGTASGYSAAILSLCCKKVDTIEIDPGFAKNAENRLRKLGFKNINVHYGNGSLGLLAKSPFDAIIVTAAAKEIPQALIDQLKEGGRIVIPLQIEESDLQELVLGVKEKDRLNTKRIFFVKFVPLI